MSMKHDVTEVHEEKETLVVDVNLPGHDPRTTTALFTRTKKLLEQRVSGRCFICGRTSEEAGPHEAHHFPVERSLATGWNWQRFAEDCKLGLWGAGAQAFDWDAFLNASPFDPYRFVDDMTVNGMLLCKEDHTGKDAGIHYIPLPLWLWRKYAPEGYEIRPGEHIKHDFT